MRNKYYIKKLRKINGMANASAPNPVGINKLSYF